MLLQKSLRSKAQLALWKSTLHPLRKCFLRRPFASQLTVVFFNNKTSRFPDIPLSPSLKIILPLMENKLPTHLRLYPAWTSLSDKRTRNQLLVLSVMRGRRDAATDCACVCFCLPNTRWSRPSQRWTRTTLPTDSGFLSLCRACCRLIPTSPWRTMKVIKVINVFVCISYEGCTPPSGQDRAHISKVQ